MSKQEIVLPDAIRNFAESKHIWHSTEVGVNQIDLAMIPNSSTSYVLVNGQSSFPTIRIGGTGQILVSHYIDPGVWFGNISSTNLQHGVQPVYLLQVGWATVNPGTYDHRIIASVTGGYGSTAGAYSTIRYKAG